MQKYRQHILPALLILLLSALALWGLAGVPFHPDESTQLFMSSDFEALFTDPLSMAWDPARESDPRQHYRELDAPLTRYLLGLGRWSASLPRLEADWDWSKTWEQNRQTGALPSTDLLYAGRLVITLLLPLSLLFIYMSGRALGWPTTGLLAALLLGLNALVLLHDRRAMAEGTLTLGVCLATWGFIKGDRRPWLAGLGLAVAFNAKQSTLALLPAGLLAVAWLPVGIPQRLRKASLNIIQFLGVFALLSLALNPLWWRNPVQALRASWNSRQVLLQRQVADTLRLAPEQVLDTPAKRTLVLMANLYLTPPAFAEVGNYQGQTAAAEQAYLDIPAHNLMRGILGGGCMLFLTFFGIGLALLRMRRAVPAHTRALCLILLATACQTAGLLLTVPLPWQRYVMPLAPFVCLWVAFPVGEVLATPNTRAISYGSPGGAGG